MIDQLARQLADDLNRFFSRGETDDSPSESQIKALVEAGLRKLNLVTREEFDAQQAVLKRTRQKVDELQDQLAALEKSLRDNIPDNKAPHTNKAPRNKTPRNTDKPD